MAATKIPATLIPGDGIGPEVTAATLQVLDALGAPFEFETREAGMAGVKQCGDPLPPDTLASIRKTRSGLPSALTASAENRPSHSPQVARSGHAASTSMMGSAN